MAGGQQQSAVRTYTTQPELEYTRLLAQTHQLSERLLVLLHRCFPVAVLYNFSHMQTLNTESLMDVKWMKLALVALICYRRLLKCR